MDNLIQLGVKTDLWVEVKATDEIMMRRFLYWMLAYFLDECELEHGINFKNKMQEWIREAHPPPSAVKYCDQKAVKLICDNVQDGVHGTFQESVIAVTAALKDLQTAAMLYATGPSRGRAVVQFSASLTRMGVAP